MDNLDHCKSGRVTKREAKKPGRNPEQRVKSRNVLDAREGLSRAKAVLRNSRARRVHQISQRPGHGGMTGKGVEELRRIFSKKIPEGEKPSLREMDETAITVVLQLAAEELDCTGLTYDELMEVSEKLMMADRAENARAEEGEKDLKVEEDTRMAEVEKVKESPGSIGGRESEETPMMSETVEHWQMTCSHRYK